jgi:hypothetical protein
MKNSKNLMFAAYVYPVIFNTLSNLKPKNDVGQIASAIYQKIKR